MNKCTPCNDRNCWKFRGFWPEHVLFICLRHGILEELTWEYCCFLCGGKMAQFRLRQRTGRNHITPICSSRRPRFQLCDGQSHKTLSEYIFFATNFCLHVNLCVCPRFEEYLPILYFTLTAKKKTIYWVSDINVWVINFLSCLRTSGVIFVLDQYFYSNDDTH